LLHRKKSFDVSVTENSFSQKLESFFIKDTFQFYRKALTFSFFSLTGYSASALLAIIFAIPFGLRLLDHHDSGRWQHFGEAFYTAYFELFLGNACLGERSLLTVNVVDIDDKQTAEVW
jgi:hypothetical protein